MNQSMTMAQTRTHLPSIEVRDLPSVKHVKVFRNDDFYFCPHQVNINQRKTRTFDSFLDDLNDHVHLSRGAVRRVYTPGGSRVTGLEQLEDGRDYIAAGNEAYRRLPYTDIESRLRRPHKAKIDEQILPPINSKFRQISGRYKKIRVTGITILIHINGDEINPPKVVLLNNKEQHNWDGVLNAVNERIKTNICRPLARLYTVEGGPILEPNDLEHNRQYVAVASYEPFKRCSYGFGMPNITTSSPRLDKRLLPPVKRKYKSSQGTPESPMTSNADSVNTYGSRSRRVVGQGNGYFHAKPVKHKRIPPDKQLGNHQLHSDQDGVFKAKTVNRATAGALEVQESRDTRVDLPIDQLEAEEVKTESIGNKPKPNNRSTIKEHDQRTQYQNRQKEADHGHGKKESRQEPDQSLGQKEPKRAGYRPRPRHQSPKRNQLSPIENDQNTNNAAIHSSIPTSNALFQSPSPSPPQSPTERTHERAAEKKHENEAATKIQANYRGYKARQDVMMMKEKAAEEQQKFDTVDDDEEIFTGEEQERHDRENQAATKIQANYRGYRGRKQLLEQKQQEETTPDPTRQAVGNRTDRLEEDQD